MFQLLRRSDGRQRASGHEWLDVVPDRGDAGPFILHPQDYRSRLTREDGAGKLDPVAAARVMRMRHVEGGIAVRMRETGIRPDSARVARPSHRASRTPSFDYHFTKGI